MLYTLTSLLALLSFYLVQCSDLQKCGIIMPSVRKYIYGGRSAFIEQWPWQVNKYKFAVFFQIKLLNK